MKTLLPLVILLGSAAPALVSGAENKPPAQNPSADARRHPLKGVVTSIMADRSAVMVKHEAIPGVMRAMTMLFKVEAATLQSVQPGDQITALMYREEGEWRLSNVKVVARKTD